MKNIIALTLAASMPTLAYASPRIIGGSLVADLNGPVVQVSLDGLGACTGSIVAPDVVLTANHCLSLTTTSPRASRVMINGKLEAVRRIVRHPELRELKDGTIYNDVALLFLAKKTKIAPLPFARSVKTFSGQTIEMIGFGVDENGEFGTLKNGLNQVLDTTSDFVTALYEGLSTEVNTCYGDSGGPALTIIKGKRAIVGAVSTGSNPACQANDITTYINTQGRSFINFFKRHVKKGFRFV